MRFDLKAIDCVGAGGGRGVMAWENPLTQRAIADGADELLIGVDESIQHQLETLD
jgi:hypothetical protein